MKREASCSGLIKMTTDEEMKTIIRTIMKKDEPTIQLWAVLLISVLIAYSAFVTGLIVG